MRLVTDIHDLSQYHLCTNEDAYYEPFSSNQDINIFYRPLVEVLSNDELRLETYSSDGNTFIEDVTAKFYWLIATDINNQPYVLIKGKPGETLPATFVLKIVLENFDGDEKFVLFTEPYESLATGCYQPALKLEGDYVCNDNFFGHYYGSAKTVVLSNFCIEGQPCGLRYENTTIVKGRMKRQPTDVKRTVTVDTCRNVSTSIARNYLLEGYSVYPEWKVDEIEVIFAANKININDQEFLFRGGLIFEADKIACSCGFLLSAKMEECTVLTEYGCETECKFICGFYLVPDGEKDQPYFNDKGELIGTTLADLLDHFTDVYGAEAVEDMDITALNCQLIAAIKVSGSSVLPAYIYWGEVKTANRIMLQVQECTFTDFCGTSPLKCETPEVDDFEFTNGCETPEIDSTEFIDLGSFEGSCLLTPFEPWIDLGGSSVTTNSTSLHLVINFQNPSHDSDQADFISTERIGTIGAGCRPEFVRNIDLPYRPGVDTAILDGPWETIGQVGWLQIQTDGSVWFTGYYTSGNNFSCDIIFDL